MLLATIIAWYLINAQHQYVKDVPGPHQYVESFQEAKKFDSQAAAEAEKQDGEQIGKLVRNH